MTQTWNIIKNKFVLDENVSKKYWNHDIMMQNILSTYFIIWNKMDFTFI